MTEASPTSEFISLQPDCVSAEFSDVSEIPTGGFNVLLRAKRDGQWWILKGLKASCRHDFVYQELLRKEYAILSELDSPYVASAVGMETVEGYGKCIVMEWVDGMTLAQWLAGRPSAAEKRLVLSRLLDAVEYVHRHQVVHRDLKPENIMVTRNGNNVKLIDFGLADTDSYAVFKQPAGTSGFISREQLNGSDTDCRNDIYSIGSILQIMRLGWTGRCVAARCHAAIARRYTDVQAVRRAFRRLHRRFHTALLSVMLLLLMAAATLAYIRFAGPRQTYDVVADFKVGYLHYQSWGGGQVTVESTRDADTCVEIPPSVSFSGIKYSVTELTFNAFRNHHNLRCAILPDVPMHVMEGAFSGCDGLQQLYLRSHTPYPIGNKLWKTDITKIFTPAHFRSVVLHVPKGSIEAYRKSEWGRFKNIKEFV